MKGNFNFQSIWCDLRFILGLVGGIPDRWLESPVAVYTLTLISGLLFTSALLRTVVRGTLTWSVLEKSVY